MEIFQIVCVEKKNLNVSVLHKASSILPVTTAVQVVK